MGIHIEISETDDGQFNVVAGNAATVCANPQAVLVTIDHLMAGGSLAALAHATLERVEEVAEEVVEKVEDEGKSLLEKVEDEGKSLLEKVEEAVGMKSEDETNG